MRLLLDTHIALWAIVDDPKLSTAARTLIEDANNDIFVSMASVWEIATKRSVFRDTGAMPLSAREAMTAFGEAGFDLLAIDMAHVETLETLPLLHRDPFDRMLVAQALTEPMRLLTRDPKVAAYGGTVALV